MQKINDDLKVKINLFGCNLANQRKNMKYSQQEIAEMTGTTQNILSKYERGLTSPRLEYLFKLEEIGFDIKNMLITGDNQCMAYTLNHQEKMLIDLFRNTDQALQLQAIGLLATGNSIQNKLEVKKQDGDLNQNSAVIAEKQIIITKKQ